MIANTKSVERAQKHSAARANGPTGPPPLYWLQSIHPPSGYPPFYARRSIDAIDFRKPHGHYIISLDLVQ